MDSLLFPFLACFGMFFMVEKYFKTEVVSAMEIIFYS